MFWRSPASPIRSFTFALLCLLPLFTVGLFGREYWTPDEPREADIAWRMSLHPATALASFDGKPWLEKPPLSYWLAGASIRGVDDSAAAARLPNALYALIAAAAVFTLAASMGGADLGLIATLVSATALLSFRVSVWLAPDAALFAGVAVALLGAWRGLEAPPGRGKLAGYTLMHAGAAWGFFAKSAVGWVVPLLAFGTVIVWERRWRELRRPELWAGLVLQILVIGAWIAAVLREPSAAADLRGLFWNNLAGRFAAVPTHGGVDYATGHANFPGKYWVELPVYLLPWTALAVAALWRAATAVRGRIQAPAATAWRFALGASVPWLLLLSVAVTARDVYAAPSIIGFALLIALRLREAPAHAALRATLWTVLTLGLLLWLAGALLVSAGDGGFGGSSALLTIAVALAVTLYRGRRALRSGSAVTAVLCCYGGYAAVLTIWGLAFFPRIDAWQDLASVAAHVSRDVGPRPLGILAPDETTIAMMDHRLSRDVVVTPAGSDPGALAAAASRWFASHGPQSRLLVKLPGSAPGALTEWIAAHTGRRLWSDDDGPAAVLERARVAWIVSRYALPQGRRFAVLAGTGAPADAALH